MPNTFLDDKVIIMSPRIHDFLKKEFTLPKLEFPEREHRVGSELLFDAPMYALGGVPIITTDLWESELEKYGRWARKQIAELGAVVFHKIPDAPRLPWWKRIIARLPNKDGDK